MTLHVSAVLASVIGFAGWLVVDLPTVNRHAASRPILQGVSAALLTWALMRTTLTRTSWPAPWGVRAFGIGLAVLAAGLLVYSALLEIPLHQRRQGQEAGTLVTTGTYALCRHPAALWTALFLIGWFVAFPSPDVGQLALLWLILEFLVIYVQDRWIFPRQLPGYLAYKQETPFLLPTRGSLRAALRRNRRRA